MNSRIALSFRDKLRVVRDTQLLDPEERARLVAVRWSAFDRYYGSQFRWHVRVAKALGRVGNREIVRIKRKYAL